MIPVDQDRFGQGEGNCYSAAIASIVQLPLWKLERFHELYCIWGRASDAGQTISWEMRTGPHIELARLGWTTLYVQGALEPCVPRGYSIANGPAHRGVDHSCVALDGVIVHDPHPDRTGLLEIRDFEILAPVVWPASHLRLSATEGPHAPRTAPPA